MHKLTIISAFLLNLVAYAATAPASTNSTLLDILNNSDQYAEYKCPFLRSTFLDGAQYPFLKECPANMKPKSNNEIMCTIFYNNFLKLCVNSSIAIKSLINESTIQASYDINIACNNLKAVEPFRSSYKDVFDRINTYMAINCHGICMDFLSGEVSKICALSGLMSNVIKQNMMNVDKVEQNAAKIKSKNETAKLTPEVKDNNKDAVQGKSENVGKDAGDVKSDVTQSVNNQKTQNEQKPTGNQSQKKPQLNDAPKPNKVQTNPEETVVASNVAPNADLAASKEDQKKPKQESNVEISPDPVKELKKPKDNVVIKPKQDQEKNDAVDIPNENVAKKDQQKANLQQENDDLETNFEEKPEDQDRIEMMNDDDQLDDDDIQPANSEDLKKPEKKSSKPKPKEVNEDVNMPVNSDQIEEEDSFFFVYFMMVCAVFILGYIGYHNKQKVLALVIEGRRGRRNSRRSGRPNSANYHKLDSNLEEAVTSSVHKNTTNIIY
ncbi:trans-Golgi network integral membrane protein TGN38-like [Onthophagus taurus]|uniref:trans-Golgi network integral membrane protein TGN38-like n=1 Tax=Onthophagus taurus TaxID=166361 RepID=UPI0039BEB562